MFNVGFTPDLFGKIMLIGIKIISVSSVALVISEIGYISSIFCRFYSVCLPLWESSSIF